MRTQVHGDADPGPAVTRAREEQQVSAVAAVDRVVTLRRLDLIVSRPAIDRTTAWRCAARPETALPLQQVIAAAADDRVDPEHAEQAIRAGAADEHVVATLPGERGRVITCCHRVGVPASAGGFEVDERVVAVARSCVGDEAERDRARRAVLERIAEWPDLGVADEVLVHAVRRAPGGASAIEDVIARPPVYVVAVSQAADRVVARAAEERVIAQVGADDGVSERAASRARHGDQGVCTEARRNAGQQIDIHRARGIVVGDDYIGPSIVIDLRPHAPVDRVVARTRRDNRVAVRDVADRECVVASATVPVIVAAAVVAHRVVKACADVRLYLEQ